MKRIVCGEDHNVLTHSAAVLANMMNLFCFSCADVMSFTTVNVHNVRYWSLVSIISKIRCTVALPTECGEQQQQLSPLLES